MSNQTPIEPSMGRDLCRAVGRATGIAGVRNATIDSDVAGVTVIRMEFIASQELVRRLEAELCPQPLEGSQVAPEGKPGA